MTITDITTLPPDFSDLMAERDQYSSVVVVSDPDTYRDAVALRASARLYLERVKRRFEPLVDAAAKSLNQARTLLHDFEDPANKLLSRIDVELYAFEIAQEKASKRAEISLADEQQREEQNQRTLEIDHLRKTGYLAEAKKLATEPLPPIIVPIVPSEVPKIKGFHKRTTWSATVTDLKAFRAAYRASEVPEEAMVPNETFLNAMARDSKSALSIPGVTAIPKQVRAQDKIR